MEEQSVNRYFAEELLAWYKVHRRDLPWRRTSDPYKIWVSEIMLQQTRVDTVIPYYERFLQLFPTVEALAAAEERVVLKAWEGLGYYSRARNLQSAVREVKERYGGQVPDDPEAVAGLKGVGPYTAGAILSIAFNRPEPAVDGNVMRVLSRFFLLRDDIAKPSTRKQMEERVRSLIPDGEAGDFTQAMMELGATVCTPKSPGCLTCPLMERCRGRLEGEELALPVKTKAKPPREEYRLAAWIEGSGKYEGRFLVRQRPGQGLLASMWELPHYEAPDFRDAAGESRSGSREAGFGGQDCSQLLAERLKQELGIHVIHVERLPDTEHVFSHIHWKLQVHRFRYDETRGREPVIPGAGERLQWIAREEMSRLPFPNVFLRILKEQDAVSR